MYRRDRGTGGFFCSLLLPNGIHPDRIEATLTDGVLLVTAPVDERSADAPSKRSS